MPRTESSTRRRGSLRGHGRWVWSICSQRGRPADDRPGVHVDDERDVDDPAPGGDIGEVGHPDGVRPGGGEVPLEPVSRRVRGRGRRWWCGSSCRGGRPPGRGRASAARPCSGPPVALRAAVAARPCARRRRCSWSRGCADLRLPVRRRGPPAPRVAGSWRRSRCWWQIAQPCSVRTRQIGSTPNTSACSSMKVTSACVAGRARPRRKPRRPSGSRWPGRSSAFSRRSRFSLADSILTRDQVSTEPGAIHPSRHPSRREPSLTAKAHYCEPWLRTREAFTLSPGRDAARQLSRRVRRMLGYSIHPSDTGLADGMHPSACSPDRRRGTPRQGHRMIFRSVTPE